jgi:alkylation response protein AidB-like acyl-CoA dehydrogenase
LLYATARMIDARVKGFSKESSYSKLLPADLAVKTATEAIQLMGPYGVMKEHHVEKRLRDAKITQIYEGTNEIQRTVIALELTKEASMHTKQK